MRKGNQIMNPQVFQDVETLKLDNFQQKPTSVTHDNLRQLEFYGSQKKGALR